MRLFEQDLPEEETRNFEIRKKSQKEEDRSEIIISKNGQLKRILRVSESYMLDSEMKPKFNFYNFEISKICDPKLMR